MNKGNFFLLQSCTWSQDALGSALQMVTCWVSGNNAGDKITSNRLCDNLRNELFLWHTVAHLKNKRKQWQRLLCWDLQLYQSVVQSYLSCCSRQGGGVGTANNDKWLPTSDNILWDLGTLGTPNIVTDKYQPISNWHRLLLFTFPVKLWSRSSLGIPIIVTDKYQPISNWHRLLLFTFSVKLWSRSSPGTLGTPNIVTDIIFYL